jgi:hemerythrin-like domain-containing protein
MKRHPSLVRLSREHHPALVLANRACRLGAAGGEPAMAMTAEVARALADELDPHFRIEEDGLLPALALAGQTALVERTLAEHEALRALAAGIAAGDPAGLGRFGELLEAHVRFEERELFPTAETVLSAETLAGIDCRPR